jgi:predicted AlkP superfamily pyrophosphatase or phosphodiesterase
VIFTAPHEGPAGLCDVVPSAISALGLAGFSNRLLLEPARHVVVLLIDGLGLEQLRAFAADAPFLTSVINPDGESVGLLASIPTTTPANLASLGMGELPGVHGIVGASFWLPDFESLLSPLRWGAEPNPAAIQPDVTMFERAERLGVRVTTLSSGAYANSGLTQSVLRGGEYVPVADIAERITELRLVDAQAGPSLTYMYWAEHDKIGHVYGVGSEQWRASLRVVDDLSHMAFSALGSGATMVVTSDHGMVNTKIDATDVIENDQRLMESVTMIAGEPRARLVYVRSGAVADVAQAWREVLGGKAEVFTRAEVVSSRLLGHVEPMLEGRLGDLLVLARGDHGFASRTDARVSGLMGQHGSRTLEEISIPGLVLRS